MTCIERDDEVGFFFDKHCATPGGVVVAHIIDEKTGLDTATAVFSALEQAYAWADAYRVKHDDDSLPALFVLYVVDEPDYGNVPVSEQH